MPLLDTEACKQIPTTVDRKQYATRSDWGTTQMTIIAAAVWVERQSVCSNLCNRSARRHCISTTFVEDTKAFDVLIPASTKSLMKFTAIENLMTNKHLGKLLDEIHELERVVAEKVQETKKTLTYEIEHGRAVFNTDVRRRHRAMMKRAWRTVTESTFLTIATAPFIYALILPISMLDLFVSMYQWVCFRVYRIPRVLRNEYVVVDRQSLAYLNVIEKMNCVYCGYCNGVLAFAREVAARTEQYWCPIKHAKKAKGCHSRTCLFCEFGDAEGYAKNLQMLRKEFQDLSSRQ